MKGVRKLAWVEVKLFVREPFALVVAFAFPFFMLFVLVGVFGNEVETTDPEAMRVWRGVGPSDFYVSTYVGLVVASAGLLTLPLRLAGYREAGVLRRYRAAGLSVTVVLGAQVLVCAGMAVAGAVGIVTTSTLVYGTALPADWALTVIAAAIGVAAFSSIGLFLGAVLPTARAVQGTGLALFFAMMMLSGSGPPRGVLTDSMRRFSDLLPLTHLNLLLQDAWLGFGWATTDALITVGFLAGSAVLAVRFFRWE
ncbi:MAG: ABC transporter permease [Chloroflexi bacterium]|nr:ABC transporter permease [Chloroflexota bacterium]